MIMACGIIWKCLQVTLRRTKVRESSLWASCTSSQEKTTVRERMIYFLYSRQFLLTRSLFKFTISYPQSFILCWFSFVWFFLMQKYLVSLSSNKIFFMILKSIDKCIVNKRRKYWISLEFFVKVIKVWKNCNRLKATVKRATNTCNLILNIAAERVNKHVMPVLQSTFKPVLKQIKVPVSWVNTDLTDWIRLCRSHAIQRHYVTCCKTSLPWAGKTRNVERCKR